MGSGGDGPSTQAGPGDLAGCVFGLELDLGMIKRPFSGHFQNGAICPPTQNTEGSPEWRAWWRGSVDRHDRRCCRSRMSPLPLTRYLSSITHSGYFQGSIKQKKNGAHYKLVKSGKKNSNSHNNTRATRNTQDNRNTVVSTGG